MRYAIISDVHANLEALEAVLADIEARRPDRILCLGDYVGYGPDPNACVDRLRPRVAAGVLGNHDAAALEEGDAIAARFNRLAYEAIRWTRQQLTGPVRAYLHNLPAQVTPDHFLIVHGSVRDPVEEYILDAETAWASFQAAPFERCFVGHTHVPAVFTYDGAKVEAAPLAAGETLALRPGVRYILNAGSVGQPRDGDPRAAYLWFDADAQTATLIRLAYPLERTQSKMRDAGLPELLAERLAYGR